MAEELKVNIVGDASQLKGALDSAGGNITNFSQKIGKIGKVATVAGAVVVGALAAIVTKTAAVGDQFDKMSIRTGIAVEDLSALAYAADISGSDIATVEKGIKGLTTAMDDASKGVGVGKEAFEELNIEVVDSEGNLRGTVDVIREVASKISTLENPTKQAAIAMDLFGARAGPQLLPLLKAGEGGIEDLMAKAKELGITMSTEAATKAAEFTDRMTDLKGSLAGAGRTIGEVLIPVLIPMIEKVTEIIGKVSSWAKANPELVATITKVAGVIAIAAAVGGPILMAVSAFTKVAGAIQLIGTLTTGPIGLVILAITGLALAWKTNFMGIQEKTKAVIDFVKKLFSGFINFITGIKDKISGVISGIANVIGNLIDKLKGTKTTTEEVITPGIIGDAIIAASPSGEIPFHQTGIKYVPRKAFYGLDPGERVLTKEENIKYDQQKSYSPTVNITVQGDGDASKIKQIVEQALEESARQYSRKGYELVPGIG